jgi:acyl-CoA synthetase (AMP-forming)/AMP-acid ligase II
MSQVADLQAVFAAHAQRPCLVEAGGAVLTYGQVEARALAVADRLIGEGVEPGDVVALFGDNGVDFAVQCLGAWTAGAVVAPINKDLGPAQIAGILDNAAPRLILAPDSVLKSLAAQPAERLRALDGPSPPGKGAVARVFERLAPDEPFMLIYTAGSTGAPKGVQIAPQALLANERLFCAEMGVGPSNRFYNILPMSYLGGLHNLLLLPLTVGASVAIDAPLGVSNLFYFWRRVRDLEIDTLWFTGAMLSMLLQIPPRGDEAWIGRQIRLGLVGMAPLDARTRRQFEQRFGFALHQNYALSETLFLTSQRPGRPADPLGCGPLLPGMQIELRGPGGALAGPGEEGELHIRTPHMMVGYRNPAAADAAALKDGVFRSGDIGRFKPDGELMITGRIKDLIIRGGLNIAPSAVEAVILACPGVREAAVVGAPDPVYGEEVAAVVTGDDADLETRVMAHAADNLPQFQRPKTVAHWDALPRNHGGKIDKPAIRRRLAELRGESA